MKLPIIAPRIPTTIFREPTGALLSRKEADDQTGHRAMNQQLGHAFVHAPSKAKIWIRAMAEQ